MRKHDRISSLLKRASLRHVNYRFDEMLRGRLGHGDEKACWNESLRDEAKKWSVNGSALTNSEQDTLALLTSVLTPGPVHTRNETALSLLEEHCSMRRYRAGDIVVEQGQPRRHFLLVVRGRHVMA